MTLEQRKAERDRTTYGVLGDINPTIVGHSFFGHRGDLHDFEDTEPMDGGSRRGNSHHAGSREMTEGVTGGTGTEVGGTRNYRQGTGFTGGDIGNRPE
jgi:hypothetical protein